MNIQSNAIAGHQSNVRSSQSIPSMFARKNSPELSRLSFLRSVLRVSIGLAIVGQGFLFAQTVPDSAGQPISEQQLYERGARRVYRGEYLKAISLPIGGIAAGPVQINGEARRHSWQIFRNYDGVSLPNSFFAVRAQKGGSSAIVRVLQTVGEGPYLPMKELSFRGEYPFGWFDFQEPELPVKIKMEVFSPLIPLNTKDSSIPCAIFNLTAENKGNETASVSFLATQRNPIGSQPKAAYGRNINRVVRSGNICAIQFESGLAKKNMYNGELVLATSAADAKASAQWNNLESLLEEFSRTGTIVETEKAGPSPPGETLDGAISVPFVLKPGEKRTVTFVMAWYFPNTFFNADKIREGNMYENWWPDAMGVAKDVLGRMESLTAQTRRYNEAFYQTNLPYWLLDRISSQVSILGAMNCNWAKDGFFYAFEGCNPTKGSCNGNASHVWGYVQAHARLFPDIARRMREQELAAMNPEGWLPLRFVGVDSKRPAFDGSCHEISAVLREHQICSDPAWLAGRWPAVRRAMDYMIQRWDPDEDGMLSGPQWGMDGNQGGTSSWMGSCYLNALASAGKIARLQNDMAAAGRYEAVLQRGRANQDKALFNGEYFIQIPDAEPNEDYLTGCYTDQMLGQWWALQINNGWLYPREHVKSAMAALFKYNFQPNFRTFKQWPRTFCKEDDAGMVQCTWPRGGKPPMKERLRFTDEVMSGFEYSAAALMIQAGCMREGFTVLHAAADRYDGRLREFPDPKKRPTKQLDWWNWGYSGNPFGDDECGKFYVRAMAIWSVLLACQGFEYDATTGTMEFAPLWKPENHVSFFTAAEGWGNFSQKIKGESLHASLDLKWGQLSLQTLVLTAPKAPASVEVKLSGRTIPAKFSVNKNRMEIKFSASTLIRAGEKLEVYLK